MWILKARDFVSREHYVRLRYYDNQNEYDSLRIIQALDADDAIAQVTWYAKHEDMYWFDVSLPTPKEMAQMKVKFDQEWADHKRKKLQKDSGATGPQPC